MGQVKDFFWEEICSEEYQRSNYDDSDFDLEMLSVDAERAAARLNEALRKRVAEGQSHRKETP